MMMNRDNVIKKTQTWLQGFIVKLNICPFAKREIEGGGLKIHVADTPLLPSALEELLMELLFLDTNPSVATTLLVFPALFKDFFQYLDFVEYAELLLQEQGYEGTYQLATFHPDYCFAGTDFDDVSNYTNRSPYPMLHILREEDVEKAIAYYGDTTKIPENNIATMNKLGLSNIKKILLGET